MEGKRTALVTGGSRGIGKELVRAFAANGYNVAFCYKSNDAAADELLSELLNNEVNVLKIKCDVSDFNRVSQMFSTLKQHFGFIDTVVNNAAIARRRLFTEETEQGFDDITGANLKSVFNVCSHFVPDMVSAGFGRIINISSVWGIAGAAAETLYSMTKAGVIGLTRSLARELAPSGVTVNAVAPGYVETEMNADITQDDRAEFVKKIPANRTATPDEIVSAVMFFADVKSGYVTGQVVNVDGGLY